METKETQKPFFAQFLDGDMVQTEAGDPTSPYKDPHTNKYPSDGDDDLPPDWIV